MSSLSGDVGGASEIPFPLVNERMSLEITLGQEGRESVENHLGPLQKMKCCLADGVGVTQTGLCNPEAARESQETGQRYRLLKEELAKNWC